jgi:hypothetical protein
MVHRGPWQCCGLEFAGRAMWIASAHREESEKRRTAAWYSPASEGGDRGVALTGRRRAAVSGDGIPWGC